MSNVEVITRMVMLDLESILRFDGAQFWVYSAGTAHWAYDEEFETGHCGVDLPLAIRLDDLYETIYAGGYDKQTPFCLTCAELWRSESV